MIRSDFAKTVNGIAERIFQKAKILLKHSTWAVADIAYALGFTEVKHFNNFFKKECAVKSTQI